MKTPLPYVQHTCITFIIFIPLNQISSLLIQHFSPLYSYDYAEKGNFKFGVSRLGSGSHTMAQYLCSLHGKSTGKKNMI